MRIANVYLTLFVTLVLAASSGAWGGQTLGHTVAWTAVGCAENRALGNVSPSRLADELNALQGMHGAAQALMADAGVPRPQLQVLVKCGPEATRASGFASGKFLSIVFQSCRPSESDVSVREEVLRQLIERSFENPPLWLSVGVARYVAAATYDTQANRGYPLAEDVVALRAPWLPVRSVFSATRESPGWRETNLRRQLVAQSALYVAYWRSRRPDGDLSRVVLDRALVGPEVALTNALGVDLDVFGAEAERYFRGGTVQRVRLRGAAEAIGCVRAADEREVKALWIHGLINQGRLTDARAAFKGVSAELTESAVLRTAGARLLAAEGRRTEAITEFARLEKTGTDSREQRRFFAEALLELGPGSRPIGQSDAEKAEELLNDSLDDSPAEVYDLLARAALVRGDAAGAALDALEAFARWPRHEFALVAAEAYAKTGNRAGALEILRSLAHGGESAEVRRSAAALLTRMGSADASAPKPLPVLRRPRSGDRTTAGRFVGMECGDTWTVLRVSAGGLERRYAMTRLDLLDIRSYRAETVQPVRCDGRRQPEEVRVTWRHENTTPPTAEGIAVALEFLP